MRSTVAGTLSPLRDRSVDPSGDHSKNPGFMSFVGASDRDSRVRNLPTFYLGGSPVFADRDSEVVMDRAHAFVHEVARFDEVATYTASACWLEGVPGIYLGDMFERAKTRRDFQRAGIVISTFQTVSFDGSKFASIEGSPFVPQFVIFAGPDDRVDEVTPALTAWSLASFRLGKVGSQEMSCLIRLSQSLVSISSHFSEGASDELRHRLGTTKPV